ncbi:PrgI family mobile element protein [Actinospica robiniae]|uniref:TraG/VirB4 family ATPase n=1 Tax=Actinospica robiniae TaxID=304901 RepID=UPI000419C65B|nr:PrgI family protein [Actinospica robiniae]
MTTHAVHEPRPPAPVAVPADLSLEDRLIGPLTARQCAILAAAGTILWLAARVLRGHVPNHALLVGGMPIALATVGLVMARPGGIPADRLAMAAIKYVLGARRRAAAADTAELPKTIRALAPLYRAVTGADGEPGVIDLGRHGCAVMVEIIPACLQLADTAEVEARLAAIGHVLASQTGAFSLTTTTERVSLDEHADRGARAAEDLENAKLSTLATQQAEYLRQLATQRTVWSRRVVLAVRETGSDAGAKAAHRAKEAAVLLSTCGMPACVLGRGEATAALTAACDPERLHAPAQLAAPNDVITAPHAPADQPSASVEATTGITPLGIEVLPRSLLIDGTYATTLLITGYPSEVLPGWLETLSSYPARLDIALHAAPVPAGVAADRLRRRRARLEAGRRSDAQRGKLADPLVESAAQDAETLAHRVARAQTRLFTAALYITVYADGRSELNELTTDVKALLSASLTTAQTPTFRMLDAWRSTLPAGPDLLGHNRVLDTAALAACSPLTSPETDAADSASSTSVLAGLNAMTGTPVFRDRWSEVNHNSLILGASGSGKSFLAKTDLIRELCAGTVASVIDPEGEYAAIAEAVGGRVVRLGLPGQFLNVLDLPDPSAAGPCELAVRVLDLHALVEVLLGNERAEQYRPALDRAAMNAYSAAGITTDPASWHRRAPDLGDVAACAEAAFDPTSCELAAYLEPYTRGSFRALFTRDHKSDVESSEQEGEAPLTVYTLENLPDVLRTPAALLVLSECWRRAQSADRRRMVLIDEAWQLLRDEAASRFVYRIAKSARKRQLALSLVTQDAEDLLHSDLGTAVASNAATQILLHQAPQALALVTERFRLSAGERDFLAAAPRGYALARTGSSRAALAAISTPTEDPFLHTGINGKSGR